MGFNGIGSLPAKNKVSNALLLCLETGRMTNVVVCALASKSRLGVLINDCKLTEPTYLLASMQRLVVAS